MSKVLLELENRSITDDGKVVVKYDLLYDRVLSGEKPSRYITFPNRDVSLYNVRNPAEAIETYQETEEASPNISTYEWNIPEKYKRLNIVEYVVECYNKADVDGEEYVSRLEKELTMMEERGMFDFLRCLVYIMDVFRENKVVRGCGRGSSCASLVLYLLGVHKVDPILYGIPIEEFLK